MEYQERQQLGLFLQKMTQARVDQRDQEAESLIREACAAQPDAAYLLVQRTLLLEQALAEAHAANARLQSELSAARNDRPTVADQNAWGTVPSLPNSPRNSMSTVARPEPQPMSPPAMAAAPAAPAASAWGGSFLGTVASTAVGVAAGSFLFHGLSNAFGNHHAATPPATQPLANSHEAVTNSAYDGGEASAGGLDNLGPGGDEWA